MKNQFSLILFLAVVLTPLIVVTALVTDKAIPVFENGEAQVVPAFESPDTWIREDLWVETEFDTDGDGDPDRMHVGVTRPRQTESEGLKLPVIYVSSPYFAGVAPFVDGLFWDVRHELGEAAKTKRVHPEVERKGKRPIISNSHIENGCHGDILWYTHLLRERVFQKGLPRLEAQMNPWPLKLLWNG